MFLCDTIYCSSLSHCVPTGYYMMQCTSAHLNPHAPKSSYVLLCAPMCSYVMQYTAAHLLTVRLTAPMYCNGLHLTYFTVFLRASACCSVLNITYISVPMSFSVLQLYDCALKFHIIFYCTKISSEGNVLCPSKYFTGLQSLMAVIAKCC